MIPYYKGLGEEIREMGIELFDVVTSS